MAAIPALILIALLVRVANPLLNHAVGLVDANYTIPEIKRCLCLAGAYLAIMLTVLIISATAGETALILLTLVGIVDTGFQLRKYLELYSITKENIRDGRTPGPVPIARYR